MSALVSHLLAVAMLVGHVAAWTWLYNRLHASCLPSSWVQRLEKLVILAMCGTLLVLVAWLWRQGAPAMDVGQGIWSGGIVRGCVLTWTMFCWAMLVYVTLAWALRCGLSRGPRSLVSNDTTILSVESALGYRPYGDRLTRLLGSVPGNQILEIHLQHKVIGIPGLPAGLSGLRIAQLTDLHMTGQLSRDFFEAAIDRMNQWSADVVAVTGDLVDTYECIEWIPATLGRLSGRFGVYAILGNHDQRIADVARLRRAVRDCGIVDLGGQCVERNFCGVPVLLAGNECPWFPPAPTVPRGTGGAPAFSILLSHSPDPLPWARRRQFNLMLAGHTHGGQIRFPLIGPVVCPSRFGVRYASGLFDTPPTILHVSRGLSGVHPIRLNCPPEITLLELQPGDAAPGPAH